MRAKEKGVTLALPDRGIGRPTIRKFRCIIVLMFVAAILVLFLEACHAPMPPTRMVCGACEEQDRMVRLQPVPRQDGQGVFTHPFLLSPEDWTVILKSIHVQDNTEVLPFITIKGAVKPAFTEDEIEYFSTRFSRVFAQARPDERVVFGLSRPQSADITEITSGGWFVNGPSLYFVLAHYRYAVTMPTIRERIWQDPLRPVSPSSYDLVPREFQTIVLDSSAAGLLSPSPSSLSIGYNQVLVGQPPSSSAVENTQASSGLSPLPTRKFPPSSSIEERLQTLKRLKDHGLITDEEYRTKRQQLLEQF